MSDGPSPTADKGEPLITLGVEEEFFLVDPDSRDLLADPDPGIFETCDANCRPHKVVREFLRSQIETNTRVCESVAEVRAALRQTRRLVIEAAQQHGSAVITGCSGLFASKNFLWTSIPLATFSCISNGINRLPVPPLSRLR